MRITVLLNPRAPCEHGLNGGQYAEASFGMDSLATNVMDNAQITSTLRAMADLLETPMVADDPDERAW